MERPETALKTLELFGLTSNQAKIYLVMVKLGSAGAGKIARYSGVRREDVYRALPRLETLGLIEKSLGTPSEIRVVSVEDALAALVKQQQNEADSKIAELLRKKDQLLENWKTVTKAPVQEDPDQFSLLQGKNAVSVKAESLIKGATKGIDYLVPKEQLGHFLSSYGDSFKRAVKRQIAIRIITEPPGESGELPSFLSRLVSSGGISLRCVDSVPIHCGIFDKKEVLAATSVETSAGQGSALYSRNQPLVQALQKVFDDLWNSSKDWNAARFVKTEALVTRVKTLNHKNGNGKIVGQLGQNLC